MCIRHQCSKSGIMSGKYAFTKSLKEVRFLFCQTSDHSAATRSFTPCPLHGCFLKNNLKISFYPLRLVSIRLDLSLMTTNPVEIPFANRAVCIVTSRSFLTRAYPTMKKNNPHTPIMLREALGTEPRVFTRYGMCAPKTFAGAYFLRGRGGS